MEEKNKTKQTKTNEKKIETTINNVFNEKKATEGFKNMFVFENVSLPLSIISIVFTFLFNLTLIVSAAGWLVYTFYCFAFGFAISALCFSLLSACQKEKVVFLPSLVVSLVAIFAIVV